MLKKENERIDRKMNEMINLIKIKNPNLLYNLSSRVNYTEIHSMMNFNMNKLTYR
jgi:hypothetical protein